MLSTDRVVILGASLLTSKVILFVDVSGVLTEHGLHFLRVLEDDSASGSEENVRNVTIPILKS